MDVSNFRSFFNILCLVKRERELKTATEEESSASLPQLYIVVWHRCSCWSVQMPEKIYKNTWARRCLLIAPIPPGLRRMLNGCEKVSSATNDKTKFLLRRHFQRFIAKSKVPVTHLERKTRDSWKIWRTRGKLWTWKNSRYCDLYVLIFCWIDLPDESFAKQSVFEFVTKCVEVSAPLLLHWFSKTFKHLSIWPLMLA